MKLKYLSLSKIFIFFFCSIALSHGQVNLPQENASLLKKQHFPNTENFLTLVSDLHTHSVFSDGHVWPNIRVAEALNDGTQVLAITEHIEFQPHLKDLPHEDRNRSYEEAKLAAKEKDLIVINGAEITRDMPTGHINAIFVEDVNKLYKIDKSRKAEAEKKVKEILKEGTWKIDIDVLNKYALTSMWPSKKSIKAANKQGAFLFWNHPMWTIQADDGIASLSDFHKEMIQMNLLHGIEIVNGNSYSEEAFQIAIDNDLTLIGTSDVHNLIEWDYLNSGGHRPSTIILAKNKNKNSIRNSLKSGRTIIWFKNSLIGLKKNLLPLLEASLFISQAEYLPNSNILKVKIENKCGIDFKLLNKSKYSFQDKTDLTEIPAHSSAVVEIKTLKKLTSINLDVVILNALVSPKENAKINLSYNL
ncbi:MAG: PHP domain-containing protein [Gammaproteobacteria bacterium]|nr:PHP domain-containing protein [Gammaproteobacteria bacterium]